MEGDWLYPCLRRCGAFAIGPAGSTMTPLSPPAALKQLRIPEPTLSKLGPGPSNTSVVVVEGLLAPPPSEPHLLRREQAGADAS
jgi:hypothetical protein